MSNLPPGVSESMIPGNRPEDVTEDAFWHALNKKFEAECPNFMEIIDWLHNEPPALVELEAAVDGYVTYARDIGYEQGYAEGKAEAQIEEALRVADEVERKVTRLPMMEAE